jgi:hypothetical protein
VDLVVVVVSLQVADDMLPVGRQDITRGSLEALVDLINVSIGGAIWDRIANLRWPRYRCKAQRLAHTLAPRAIVRY